MAGTQPDAPKCSSCAGSGLASRTPWPGGWDNRPVDAGLLEVRNVTYRTFVELGRAPSAGEVAGAADRTSADVEAAWRELHRAHALVLDPATNEIRMANPFSAVPTGYRVQAAGRWWYGNCAWDALGICAALRTDGRIETSCSDCGETIVFEVRKQRVDDERLLFHCLVPAAHWWDDIIFT
jgi:Alkylmercury lyase